MRKTGRFPSKATSQEGQVLTYGAESEHQDLGIGQEEAQNMLAGVTSVKVDDIIIKNNLPQERKGK